MPENENIEKNPICRAQKLATIYDKAILNARKIRDNPTWYKGVTRKKAEMALEDFKEACFKKVRFEQTIFTHPRKAIKSLLKATHMAEKNIPIFATPLKQAIKKEAPAWYYQACFDIELDHLRTKVADLDNRGFKTEANTLSELINLLEEKHTLFYSKQTIDCKTFVSECQELINKYKPLLWTHRGILGIVDTILEILYIVINGLDIFSKINPVEEADKARKNTGCFFFTTKTFQRLEKLEQEINAFDFRITECETSFSLCPRVNQESSL